MTFVLRDYQRQVVQDAREALWSLKQQGRPMRILLQAPTGSGKTVIASHIIDRAADKGSHCLFFAHRRELVFQCADKLEKFGVHHGIVMAGQWMQPEYEVQVASIQTLHRRGIASDQIPLPKADIIFIDEAHRSLSPTYLKLMELYPEAAIIGMTATPCRTDGKGLGHMYEGMVSCPSVQELTDMGHLVPVRYFAPSIPDLTGVKVVRGDYDTKQLERAMEQRNPVGDIVTNWQRIAPDRRTMVFATSVRHSIAIADEFKRAGVSAIHIDGGMQRRERDEAVDGLLNGRYQVVVNCMVLTEGFDMPALDCCVMARPTKSVGLFLQMGGRTLRPAEGKEDSILIDHSGNIYEHGFIADERHWRLTKGRAMKEVTERERTIELAKTITCVQCAHVYSGQRQCPNCGHEPKVQGELPETRHADLREVKERKTPKTKVYSGEEKQVWLRMFVQHARECGYKIGWAAWAFKTKFGHWPVGELGEVRGMGPSREASSYIRYLNIRAHHARKRGNSHGNSSRA